MTNFTRMAMAYPFPLPEPPKKPVHQPTYYLSDEASALRIAALAEKIAADPNSVPVSAQRKVLADLARIVGGGSSERKEAA